MSFPPAAQLWATTMVRHFMLFCNVDWFDSSNESCFPVAGYMDGSSRFPGTLPSDHILFLEQQRRCVFFMEALIRFVVVGLEKTGVPGLTAHVPGFDRPRWWPSNSVCRLGHGCVANHASLPCDELAMTANQDVLKTFERRKALLKVVRGVWWLM